MSSDDTSHLPYPEAMSNLKPFVKGEDRTRLIGKMGGISTSVAKSDAAKLRNIKQRLKRSGLTEEDQKWMLQMIEDRPAMAAEILMTAKKIREDLDEFSPVAKVMYGNYEVNAAKFIHGEKLKTENVNINIDFNDAIRQAYEKRKNLNNSSPPKD